MVPVIGLGSGRGYRRPLHLCLCWFFVLVLSRLFAAGSGTTPHSQTPIGPSGGVSTSVAGGCRLTVGRLLGRRIPVLARTWGGTAHRHLALRPGNAFLAGAGSSTGKVLWAGLL